MKRLTLSEKIQATLARMSSSPSVAWWKTAPSAPRARKAARAAIASTDLVDLTTYVAAPRLAQVAITPEEQRVSQSALRIADHELELSFRERLRDVQATPPALNSDGAAIQARMAKSQTLLGADQQRVNELTAALAQAKPDQKDKIQDQLDLAQSQLELDKDELDEANQNLVEAGGNPQQQIESMVKEHEAQTKAQSNPTGPKAVAGEQGNSIAEFREWRPLRLKQHALEETRNAALLKAQALATRHTT